MRAVKKYLKTDQVKKKKNLKRRGGKQFRIYEQKQ